MLGTPKQSITIITPYQGQKRELVNVLRKEKLLPPFQPQQAARGSSHHAVDNYNSKDGIALSTVDRYQGDENDIVILSLVRTQSGNRFVTLPNRFIVAASRARLGFYIIGSLEAIVRTAESDTAVAGGKSSSITSAAATSTATRDANADPKVVGGASHWKNFVHLLQSPDHEDVTPIQRIGYDLPICCPHHVTSTIDRVNSTPERRSLPTEATWKDFCHEICIHPLKCGHPCSLSCHSFNPLKHQEKCIKELERPCEAHKDVPLVCGELNLLPNERLHDGLARWQCRIQNPYPLPACNHSMRLECCKYKAIKTGQAAWPDCLEPVSAYIHPQCNHKFGDMTCVKKREYEDKPPTCHRKVDIVLPCKHKREVECYQKYDTATLATLTCMAEVNVPRPHCGHVISTRCQYAEKMKAAWDSQGYEGVKCSTGQPVMMEGHGSVYGPAEMVLIPELSKLNKCCVDVKFRKDCGHEFYLPCHEAFEMAKGRVAVPRCDDKVHIDCVLCHGQLAAPCHVAEGLGEWKSPGIYYHKVNDLARYNERDLKVILDNATTNDRKLWKEWLKLKCCNQVQIVRSCQNEHTLTYDCHKAASLFLSITPLPKCQELTNRMLPCGHELKVKCFDKEKLPIPMCKMKATEDFVFAVCGHSIPVKTCGELQAYRLNPQLKCKQLVDTFFYRCGHPVQIPCSDQWLVSNPGNNDGGDRFLPSSSPLELLTIKESGTYCVPCADAPKCIQPVAYQRVCGHIIDRDVKCCDAFDWSQGLSTPGPCRASVEDTHPICQHVMNFPCWVWNEIEGMEQPVNHVEEMEGDYQLVHYPLQTKPKPFPSHLPLPALQCTREVFVHFDNCNHVVKKRCCDVYHGKTLTCEEKIDVICCKENCQGKRSINCNDYFLSNGNAEKMAESCTLPVPKVCSICEVNTVSSPCNSHRAYCQGMVKVVLPCEHEYTWPCGSKKAKNDNNRGRLGTAAAMAVADIGGDNDEDDDLDIRPYHDPHVQMNPRCLECIEKLWLKDADQELTLAKLRDVGWSMMEQELGAGKLSLITDVTTLDAVVFEPHLKSREELIMRKIVKAISSHKMPPPLVQYATIEEYITANYALVYLLNAPDRPADPKNMNTRFQAKNTEYCSGVKMNAFKRSIIEKQASSTGKVELWLALAYKGQVLKNAAPFKIGEGREVEKKAQLDMKKYKEQGYTCVQTLPDEQDNGDSSQEYIFWYQNSVVPLSIITIQLDAQCYLCLDSYAKDNSKGAICPSGHFACWECFDGFLANASQADAMNFTNERGQLCCQQENCKQGYDLLRNAVFAPAKTMEQLKAFETKQQINRAIAANSKELNKKHEEDIKRLMEMTEIDREVELLRLEITDKVLPVQCPRCKQAFADFEGCFALTCANEKNCSAHFCAWCLHDCGADAHDHVRRCQYALAGGLFCDKSLLKPAWNNLRTRRLKALMQGKPAQVKSKLQEKLKKDFADLHLVIDLTKL